MGTSKLYPTLTKFYVDKNIEFGSELDIIIPGLQDDRLYRQEYNQVQVSNASKGKSNTQTQQRKMSNDLNAKRSHIYPRMLGNISDESATGCREFQDKDLCNQSPAVPSAPPIDLLSEDMLMILRDAMRHQNLPPSLDEPPTADYTALNIPANIMLDETWIDDLLPDYDISLEKVETEFFNNLNITDTKVSKDKSLDLKSNMGYSDKCNTSQTNAVLDPAHINDLHKTCNVTELSTSNIATTNRCDHRRARLAEGNRATVSEDTRPERLSPGSHEYSAWMTWRKQVRP